MSCTYSIDGPHIILRFDYHPGLVEALKTSIPKQYRRWSPERQAWLIGREYWPAAQQALARFGFRPMEAPRPITAPWRVLHLLPGAPPEVVDAVFRALAKVHHPDHGGSNDRMQEINLAYDELKAGRE